MSKLVLRPSSVGGLGFYNTAWTSTPIGPYANAIDDVVADGDLSYLSATLPDSAFTVKITSSASPSWPRPSRLRSVTLLATARTLVFSPVTVKFRIRYCGVNYDSAPLSLNSVVYREIYWILPQMPTGAGWTFSALHDFEVGLVYVSGVTELRCTKLELQVQTELMPDFRLEPSGPGTFNAWAQSIPTLPAERAVNGAFDGDLSFIQSVMPGAQSSFSLSTIPPLTGYAIDRVQVKAAVRTTDGLNSASVAPLLVVGGLPYRGGTHHLYGSVKASAYPSEMAWTILEGEFLNSPSVGWPSGLPLATAWTDLELAGAEVGVENGSAVPIRCSSLALDVFLKRSFTPTDVLPVANGWHTGLIPMVPGAGEDAWQDVCEDPPDDAASYVGATAVDLSPVYGTFQFGPVPPPVPGQQVYALELRSRCTLGSTASALVAHVVNDRATGETWIGKPVLLSGVAGTWFDLKEDLPTNPLTNTRWSFADVGLYDFGWVILDGEALLSRIRVQYQIVNDLTVVPGATDFQMTTEATTWINKSKLDGSVYEVDTFAVGTGGYNPAVPTTVLPVNPADIALAAEVKRFPIKKVTALVETLPYKVTYWCRVPRDQLKGYVIGEVGLFARVLWSPVPAEIGHTFMFALAHWPAQVCTENDVFLFPAELTYP